MRRARGVRGVREVNVHFQGFFPGGCVGRCVGCVDRSIDRSIKKEWFKLRQLSR